MSSIIYAPLGIAPLLFTAKKPLNQGSISNPKSVKKLTARSLYQKKPRPFSAALNPGAVSVKLFNRGDVNDLESPDGANPQDLLCLCGCRKRPPFLGGKSGYFGDEFPASLGQNPLLEEDII